MTQEEIERLKALAEAATPGPWAPLGAAVLSAYEEPHFDEQLTIADCDMDVRIDHDTRATTNAAFIAAARDALPRLIAELEAARAEIASLRERLEKAEGLLRPFADEATGADHFGLWGSQSWPVAVERLYAARAFLQKEEL